MLKKLFSPKTTYEVAICCIVKDEEYLTEWVDYHLTVGVSQFYIYDNESEIPVSETLKYYIESGLVVVELIEGKIKQMIAYGLCLKKYGRFCKWIAFIDADEFIVPKTFTGSLPEFLVPYERYGGLGINWLVFGSNGHIEKPTGLQIECYTRRTLKSNPLNEHIKSIVQPKHVKHIPSGPHHFHYKLGRYSVNENFIRFKGPYSPHSTNKIQLNHYWLRSETDFKEKLQRGRADKNSPELARKWEDFHQTNKEANLVDETILTLKMVMGKESKL
jgi:Glycosyltransferase family 92